MKKLFLTYFFLFTLAQAQVTDSLLNLTIPLEQRVSLFISRVEPFGYHASIALQYKKQTVFLPHQQFSNISWNKIQSYVRAIAFLDAQEERKISLQNPIKSFYKKTPTYATPINLDNLLAHTAGLQIVNNSNISIDSLWWLVKKGKESIYSVHHERLADFIFEQMTGMSPLEWFKTKILNKTGTETDSGLDVISFIQIEDLLVNNKILQVPSLELLVKPYKIDKGKAFSYAWQLSETVRQTPVAFLEDSTFALRVYPADGLRIATSGKQANFLADVLARYLTDGLPLLPPKIQNLKEGALDTLNGIWTDKHADFQIVSQNNKIQIIPLNAIAFAYFKGKKLDKSIASIQQKFPTSDSLKQHFTLDSVLIINDSLIWLDKLENNKYYFKTVTDNQLYQIEIDFNGKMVKNCKKINLFHSFFLPTGTQCVETWIYPDFPVLKFCKHSSDWILEVRNEKYVLGKK